jgi:hypothetical protein
VQTAFDRQVNRELIEQSLAASAFGSMWLDIPRPEYRKLPGPVRRDLLVVGAGYAGLWTALHAGSPQPRNADRPDRR